MRPQCARIKSYRRSDWNQKHSLCLANLMSQSRREHPSSCKRWILSFRMANPIDKTCLLISIDLRLSLEIIGAKLSWSNAKCIGRSWNSKRGEWEGVWAEIKEHHDNNNNSLEVALFSPIWSPKKINIITST